MITPPETATISRPYAGRAVLITLPREKGLELRLRAAQIDTSMTGLVRRLVMEYLEEARRAEEAKERSDDDPPST